MFSTICRIGTSLLFSKNFAFQHSAGVESEDIQPTGLWILFPLALWRLLRRSCSLLSPAANGVITLIIKRQFRTRNKETILTLYNALVRPHLEYAVQFWSPSLRKDIERLEAVQARATKLIPSIRHLGYVRRLERLNLYSLEKRRLPVDRNI